MSKWKKVDGHKFCVGAKGSKVTAWVDVALDNATLVGSTMMFRAFSKRHSRSTVGTMYIDQCNVGRVIEHWKNKDEKKKKKFVIPYSTRVASTETEE